MLLFIYANSVYNIGSPMASTDRPRSATFSFDWQSSVPQNTEAKQIIFTPIHIINGRKPRDDPGNPEDGHRDGTLANGTEQDIAEQMRVGDRRESSIGGGTDSVHSAVTNIRYSMEDLSPRPTDHSKDDSSDWIVKSYRDQLGRLNSCLRSRWDDPASRQSCMALHG